MFNQSLIYLKQLNPSYVEWFEKTLAASIAAELECGDGRADNQYEKFVIKVAEKAGLVVPPGSLLTEHLWFHFEDLIPKDKFRGDVTLDLKESLNRELLPFVARWFAVGSFGFAIPTRSALNTLRRLGPIVEIGAGCGYWAYLLRCMDVDVAAYDKYPNLPTPPEAPWKWDRKWTVVKEGGPVDVALHGDRTLLLGWPPMDDMAFQCLRRYDGDCVVWIGDWDATGNDAFKERLEKKFKQGKPVALPNWPGIHDMMTIWRKK